MDQEKWRKLEIRLETLATDLIDENLTTVEERVAHSLELLVLVMVKEEFKRSEKQKGDN